MNMLICYYPFVYYHRNLCSYTRFPAINIPICLFANFLITLLLSFYFIITTFPEQYPGCVLRSTNSVVSFGHGLVD